MTEPAAPADEISLELTHEHLMAIVFACDLAAVIVRNSPDVLQDKLTPERALQILGEVAHGLTVLLHKRSVADGEQTVAALLAQLLPPSRGHLH